MSNFTPWSALIGGALIGGSASILLWFNGRIAGISSILGGLLPTPVPDDGRRDGAARVSWAGTRDDLRWRWFFIAGLLFGGFAVLAARPESFGAVSVPLPWVVASGLLVGFGTRLGGGCTSGHGVCGLSRLSSRSLVATLTFMVTGAAATFVMRHLLATGAAQ